MVWDALPAALLAAASVWLAMRDSALRRLGPTREGPRRRRTPDAGGRRLLTTRSAEARAREVRAGVPMACDLLAVCVEAGLPARGALRVVAEAVGEPTRGVLSGVAQQIELGVDEVEAWAALGTQPGYRGVARDVGRSLRSGVALGDLLRAHASEARIASETDSRARAREVAVTGVLPLVLCFLPAFVLVGIVPIFGGLIGALLGG